MRRKTVGNSPKGDHRIFEIVEHGLLAEEMGFDVCQMAAPPVGLAGDDSELRRRSEWRSPLTEYVLWAGTLGQASFEERLAATAAAGCFGMSVFPWDSRPSGGHGSRAAELRAQADDSGVRLVAVDPLSSWLPDWPPPTASEWAIGVSPERVAYAELFATYSVDECLTLGSELGADLVTVIEPYGRPVVIDVAAAAFAEVCDRAAGHDLRVQLEFMPFSGVPDLRSAWEIVDLAGRTNGGLVIDAWHFFRGEPDLALLASLPGDKVFSLQLSDGPQCPEPDLWLAAARDRLLPGAGEFDLTTLLAAVRTHQPRAVIGPEVVSAALAAMHPTQAALRAVGATASAVDAAAHLNLPPDDS
jgi:sugar phosphate isomerase/epimerase